MAAVVLPIPGARTDDWGIIELRLVDEVVVLLKCTPDEVVGAAVDVKELVELLGAAGLYTFTELILQYLRMDC